MLGLGLIMSNPRITYTAAQQIALVAQVNKVCPTCAEPLFNKKNGKSYKNYDLAHIYPLNPTPTEEKLLKNEKKLSDDINDEDNIIPLCKTCHGKFDNPRTVDEYRYLYDLKLRLIEKSGQESIWGRFSIQEDIKKVIDALYEDHDITNDKDLDYNPKTIDEKLDKTITKPTKTKIKLNVTEYYSFIKNRLSELDDVETDTSVIISLEIKAFYLKQKSRGLSQQAIFENIVDWIIAKTRPKTADAAEIIASFFVQNCEIF